MCTGMVEPITLVLNLDDIFTPILMKWSGLCGWAFVLRNSTTCCMKLMDKSFVSSFLRTCFLVPEWLFHSGSKSKQLSGPVLQVVSCSYKHHSYKQFTVVLIFRYLPSSFASCRPQTKSKQPRQRLCEYTQVPANRLDDATTQHF